MKNHARLVPAGLALAVVLAAGPAAAQRVIQPPEDPARRLGLALRKIGVDGRLLYVTAHPDDEDNALLAHLGHGRGIACTLLTLTRGEGGQNEIGEEEGEALAVLRMQELREAHRYDGADQRFSRAIDFGYSFSEEETFRKWGRDEILRDVVQIVREVRPHVILTMPAKTEGGGRHHQASALLAREAFAAASTAKWPELGAPWAADRLFEQAWDAKDEDRDLFEAPVEDYDPLLGCTYGEVGFRARSMHKCQGTPQVDAPSAKPRRSRWRLILARGEAPPPGPDLFAGLDIGATLPVPDADPLDPDRTRAALRRLLDSRPGDARVREALALAWPVLIEAVAEKPTLWSGESVVVNLYVHNRSRQALPVRRAVMEAKVLRGSAPLIVPFAVSDLPAGARRTGAASLKIPREADCPTWVTFERETGSDRYLSATSTIPDSRLARVSIRTDVDGLEMELPPVPVVMRDESPDRLSAYEEDVKLRVPWHFESPFGTRVCSERPVSYPHIRHAVFGPRREPWVHLPDLQMPEADAGYVRGPGPPIDGFAAGGAFRGRRLDSGGRLGEEWTSLRVIVVGDRAYESCADLKSDDAYVKTWMENGGHLVVLYQKPEGMNEGEGDAARSPWMPYPARVGRGRTTDENSPVTVLQPDHKFFTTPHPIRAADWEGWVQDRGLYYLESKDPRYTELIETEDPFPANAGRKRGILVTAAVGKGRWTYVGLALGRQLRAGVPGAWRLLANILAP